MTKIFSVISTKGGVGKTTLTANLAGYLHSQGLSVLMVDADPQPSLSSYYSITHKARGGLVEVLLNPHCINDNISTTTHGDLIYSNDSQSKLQHYLADYADACFRLKQALGEITTGYDFIFIDTQGTKGIFQDLAVIAAERLLSPVIPEMTTIREFGRGTLSVVSHLAHLNSATTNTNIAQTVEAIIYRIDRSNNAQVYKQILVDDQSNHPYQVLHSAIPASVVYDEAAGLGIPVVDFKNGTKKQQKKARKSIRAIEDLILELGLVSTVEYISKVR